MTIDLSTLRNLGIAVLTIGVFALAYVIFSAPSRPPVRLGIRGYKRQRALSDPSWALVDPAVQWLGLRLSGAMSDTQYAAVDRQLMLAGDYLGLTPPEFVALSILSIIVGTALGWACGQFLHVGTLVVFALIGASAALPSMLVSSETERRLRSITTELPNAIDLIALSMGAGLDFPRAVRQVVEKSSHPNAPLQEELGWVLHKIGLAKTRRQALEEFAQRAPVAIVLEFVGAVVQADERGHPLAQVLQVQATTFRQRRSVRSEESAAKAGVALMAPLLMLFLSVLLLVMAPLIIRLSETDVFGGPS